MSDDEFDPPGDIHSVVLESNSNFLKEFISANKDLFHGFSMGSELRRFTVDVMIEESKEIDGLNG